MPFGIVAQKPINVEKEKDIVELGKTVIVWMVSDVEIAIVLQVSQIDT